MDWWFKKWRKEFDICTLMGLFCTEELCLMTLKSDFKEKLIFEKYAFFCDAIDFKQSVEDNLEV